MALNFDTKRLLALAHGKMLAIAAICTLGSCSYDNTNCNGQHCVQDSTAHTVCAERMRQLNDSIRGLHEEIEFLQEQLDDCQKSKEQPKPTQKNHKKKQKKQACKKQNTTPQQKSVGCPDGTTVNVNGGCNNTVNVNNGTINNYYGPACENAQVQTATPEPKVEIHSCASIRRTVTVIVNQNGNCR